MYRYRSQRVAFAVSLLIHILIIFIYRPLARIDIFPKQCEPTVAGETEPLVFQLVETPDDAIRQRPEATNLLSDKNAVARDEYRDSDKENGYVYSEGQVPYWIFSGQLEPDGSNQTLSRMIDRNQLRDGSPDRQRSADPAGIDDYRDPKQGEIPPAALEDYLSLQTTRNPLSTHRLYSDDIDYDQRKYSTGNLGGISLSTYAWEYAHYILEMKKKLRANTHPPAAFTILGMISGEAVLRFKVLPDGTATDILVVNYRGDRTLMETSVDAVQFSSPFRPLPPDFPDEYLELKWTFIYFVYR
ncbi:MAG: energy transducer TonB [bacterium]|nr:MAG: energy transducer TonB [bacterium]